MIDGVEEASEQFAERVQWNGDPYGLAKQSFVEGCLWITKKGSGEAGFFAAVALVVMVFCLVAGGFIGYAVGISSR